MDLVWWYVLPLKVQATSCPDTKTGCSADIGLFPRLEHDRTWETLCILAMTWNICRDTLLRGGGAFHKKILLTQADVNLYYVADISNFIFHWIVFPCHLFCCSTWFFTFPSSFVFLLSKRKKWNPHLRVSDLVKDKEFPYLSLSFHSFIFFMTKVFSSFLIFDTEWT